MLPEYLENFTNISAFPLAASAIAVILAILYFIARDRNLPPGPTGLPYLGYWPFFREDSVHRQLQDMAEKYGEIFSFRATGRLFINLGSVKAIREAHVTKADCFAARPTDFSVMNYVFSDGIVIINGEPWKVLRKFFLQMFKEYSMTTFKDDMSGPVYDNLCSLMSNIRKKKGEALNIADLLTENCLNIMCRMLFKGDGMSNEDFRNLIEEYNIVLQGMTDLQLFLTGGLARHIILPLTSRYRRLKRSHKRLQDLLYEIIERHESSFDENHIRDIIDNYIKERNDRCHKGDPTAKYFTNKSLFSSLIQILGDGVLTVAGFINLFLHYLIEYPEEQEKIYAEIADVIGSERDPTLEDRSRLTYTNAFLLEVQRHSDSFPLFPKLQCTKETTVLGYRIPKGTATLMNVYSIHRDPEVYEDPCKFNPSRYISVPGQKKAEFPIAFGIGRRACLGEAYSMMQVFLFVTNFVKHFRLTLPGGVVGKSSAYLTSGKMEICAHPRT